MLYPLIITIYKVVLLWYLKLQINKRTEQTNYVLYNIFTYDNDNQDKQKCFLCNLSWIFKSLPLPITLLPRKHGSLNHFPESSRESLFKIAILWANVASAVASLNDLKIQIWYTPDPFFMQITYSLFLKLNNDVHCCK